MAQNLCRQAFPVGTYVALSTAILFVDHGAIVYTHSASILHLGQYLGQPYMTVGFILLLLFPQWLRDYGYNWFARNRGEIWKFCKRLTGLGDTMMTEPLYRSKIVGLFENDNHNHQDTAGGDGSCSAGNFETLPASWGFGNPITQQDDNKNDNKKEA